MGQKGITIAIIGALAGMMLMGLPGAVFGFISGILFGMVDNVKKRLDRLENTRHQLKKTPQTDKKGIRHIPRTVPPPIRTIPEAPDLHRCDIPDQVETPPDAIFSENFAREKTRNSSPLSPTPSEPREKQNNDSENVFSETSYQDTSITGYLKNLMTRGNIVVRVGLVVLFLGISFLLKFAAEQNMLPIELRLAGVACGALAMLSAGWRLRRKRPVYAMLVSGGAVGILYLDVFAAFNMHALIPASLAVFLMTGLVVFTGFLSVKLDAKALAVFAALGGFLAPILTSSLEGSPIILFTYLAMLNSGILGIAWFKSWRELNLVGFVLTVATGLFWGLQYYHSDYFLSTEIFLVLFFLFYIGITVLPVAGKSQNLKRYIDMPLVFGLPLIVFRIQTMLVQAYPYALAKSAIALALFYICISRIVSLDRSGKLRLLRSSFFSIGIVFSTLTIFLTFSDTWTTCIWAIEGIGLVWVGLRQKKSLMRAFGLLLQLGTGLYFLAALHMLRITDWFIASIFISIAGILSNYLYERYRNNLKVQEKNIHTILIIWGLLWWLGAGLTQIFMHAGPTDMVFLGLTHLSISCLAMGWLSRRLNWRDMSYPPMGLIILVPAIAVEIFCTDYLTHPFFRWGSLAWGMAIVTQYVLLKWFESQWKPAIIKSFHCMTLYLIIFLASWETSRMTGLFFHGLVTWGFIAWGMVPAFMVLSLLWARHVISWPVKRFLTEYTGAGLLPVIWFLWGWAISACFREGNPFPLSYLPIINPLELGQIFVLLISVKWWKEHKKMTTVKHPVMPERTIFYILSGVSFMCFNFMMARFIHFFCNIPFTGHDMFHAVVFQTTLSITWTITALGIMIAGTRKRQRNIWIIGAGLLGVVVIKLFLIDLVGIGTIARIISFTGVGILMLIIGYISPLPPRQMEISAGQTA